MTPLTTILATPLVGLLADKMGNFRHILSFSLLLSALLASSLIFVPRIQRVPECVRDHHPIEIACPTSGSTGNRFLNLTFPKCLKSDLAKSASMTRSYLTAKPLELLVLSNCRINCESKSSQLCLYDERDGDYCFHLDPTKSSSPSSPPLGTSTFTIKLSPDSDKLNNLGGRSLDALLHTVTLNSATYLDLTCRSNSTCSVKCPLSEQNVIPNHRQEIVDDPVSQRITFWMYLIIRVSLIVVIATEMSLLKSAILTIVDKNDSEYGYQRLWASIANIFIPPLTGMAMDQIKKAGKFGDFILVSNDSVFRFVL